MRWSWLIVFAAGCAAGFLVGRGVGRFQGTDHGAGRDGVAPADDLAEPVDPLDAPSPVVTTAARRSGPRAVRDVGTPAPAAASPAGALAARIAAAAPDSSAVFCEAANFLSRDDLCAAIRALLARRLSLEHGAGRSLRDVLQRFVDECPDVPLDRDDVFAFAWQDGSGLGWQLVHHLPREEGRAWFESLLLGGPPLAEASWGARVDGTGKLFDDAMAAFPDRVQGAVLRALDSPDEATRLLAVGLAARRLDLLGGRLTAAALTDPAPRVRDDALSAVANSPVEWVDANDVQRAVCAAAGASDAGLRATALRHLDRAGELGLAIARAALERGGLNSDEEQWVIGALVRGGCATDVLSDGMSESRAAALIQVAYGLSDEPELFTGLARRASELPCPAERELAGSWSTLMCVIGRSDVALGAVRTSTRSALIRMAVLWATLESDRQPLAAVACAADLLEDPASKADLRRAVVDALVEDCGDSPDDDENRAARAAALELLRKVASGDANEAVRSAAADGVRTCAAE